MGGTEITEEDLANILVLCERVIELTEYRASLAEYLKLRMNAIAPNLTVLVGELVGARLISHAGSLMNLAKQPASTVQILGAEKALFRALKTKKDTPKYGLIYHASLIGQAQPKFKGKISRVLAAKCALSIRVDALGDTSTATIGIEDRVKVEERLRQLEGKIGGSLNKDAKAKTKVVKYDGADGDAADYNDAADSTLASKKRKADDEEEEPKKKKKKAEEEDSGDADDETPKKKKKKKDKDADGAKSTEKKKKKKKKTDDDDE